MAEVYQHSENVLFAIQYGSSYFGFENGSENQIKKEPITLYRNVINPGDKIKGFDSGKNRSSFILDYGYMIYSGIYEQNILFEIYDPKAKPRQTDLFNIRPRWFLAFALVGSNAGLLMFSAPGCCYDIHPIKIIQP